MRDYNQILTSFQSGLKEGLTVLFNGYGQALYGYCREQWKLSEDESYDVVYKTIETVGKVINRYAFTSERHFQNWIFKIHKNNLLQYLRSKKAKEENLSLITFSDWANEAKEDGDAVIPLEKYRESIENLSAKSLFEEGKSAENPLLDSLQRSLQMLSDQERDLVLLRMSDYSYEQIASMLGLDSSGLRVRFLRIKNKLRQLTLQNLK